MGKKSNPQVTIPADLYQELQDIADLMGLPSPALAIRVLVKQFGGTLKNRFLQNSGDYSSPVEPTATYSVLPQSTAVHLQQPTGGYSSPVEATAVYANLQQPTAVHLQQSTAIYGTTVDAPDWQKLIDQA
jgi:hypothetical protein